MPKKLPKQPHRIKKAEEPVQDVRQGSVDAIVAEKPQGRPLDSLGRAGLPYGVLVEQMQQGAAMIDSRGTIVYCNPSLADLLGVPQSAVIGLRLQELLDPADCAFCNQLLLQSQIEPCGGEMRLRRHDGSQVSAHFVFHLLSSDKSATSVLITDLTTQKEHNELASRLQHLQDEERRRIARELHDTVGQLLVALAINTSAIKKEVHKLSPEVARIVDENAEMIDEIGKQIRAVSHLLHPPLLDEVGLPSAIRWYVDGFAQSSNIQATIDIPDNLPRMPQDMEIGIFRAVQECLTNIHRHSGSSSCAITVVQDEKGLHVEVKDSGRGIPAGEQLNIMLLGGVGLRGLQERIRLLGGSVEIRSSERGMTVLLHLPMPGPQSAPQRENVA